jgi:transcriptional regulator with XRE-family HTH domain
MEQDRVLDGTVIEGARSMLAHDDEGSRAYMKASFLTAATIALWEARQKAGLTQAELAEHMGTRQSAIARMEADNSGSMSLHRYVDYCISCGVMPFDMRLEDLDELRAFTHVQPEAPRTEVAFQDWKRSLQPTQGLAEKVASVFGNIPIVEQMSRIQSAHLLAEEARKQYEVVSHQARSSALQAFEDYVHAAKIPAAIPGPYLGSSDIESLRAATNLTDIALLLKSTTQRAPSRVAAPDVDRSYMRTAQQEVA